MDRRIIIYAANLLNIKLPKFICNKELAFSYYNGVIYYKASHISLIPAILHELRHHYQFSYIKNHDDYYSKLIVNDLNSKKDYLNSFIELDSYAFSYIFTNCYLKYNYNYLIPNSILISHIIKYMDIYKPLLEILNE